MKEKRKTSEPKGEASFAHGGCGGTKFPRKRPRVSGAHAVRFLRA